MKRGGKLYNQVAVFKSDCYRPGSDDWGTEEELETHFAKTHESVKRALLRNALFAGRTPDDFTYTDWFYGYQPTRKERIDGH